MRSVWIIAVAAIATAQASLVHADAKTEADRLFEEGVALREAGKLPEACAKFAAAMKKDERAIGTLLNLALCAEREGKVATAAKLFGEARDRATEQDMKPQKEAAEAHLATLTPQIPHLTIKLAKAVPDIKVVVDDRVIAASELVGLAIDPGTHAIDVSAPGYLPHRASVDVAAGKAAEVVVPELQTSVIVHSSKRSIGKLVTAGGAVALGTSIALGIYARRAYDREFDQHVDADGNPYFPCRANLVCDDGGQAGTDRARTFGTIATVVGGVGLAAVGVGVYLWLTAPSTQRPTDTQASLTPIVGPGEVGFATTLRW